MADNITVNTAVGTAVVATEDIAGAEIQRVKLVTGNSGIDDGNISNTNPMPVKVPASTVSNRSVTIGIAGVAQIVVGANSVRRGIEMQNAGTTAIWFSFVGTATTDSPSFMLAPGERYTTPTGGASNQALSVICSAADQKLTVWEW